jgi:hypothetical protein
LNDPAQLPAINKIIVALNQATGLSTPQIAGDFGIPDATTAAAVSTTMAALSAPANASLT